jgi:hypothetical protein
MFTVLLCITLCYDDAQQVRAKALLLEADAWLSGNGACSSDPVGALQPVLDVSH